MFLNNFLVSIFRRDLKNCFRSLMTHLPAGRQGFRMVQLGIWVEITTLVIPTLNDSDQEFEEIARFIASLGPGVPWHLSAFHPTYKMLDLPRTPASLLHRAREIGIKEGLRYVYCGNIPGEGGEETFCPHCGQGLIERTGFRVTKNDVVNGACRHCHGRIDGVWN